MDNIKYHPIQAALFIPALVSMKGQLKCQEIIENEASNKGQKILAHLGLPVIKVITTVLALPAVIYGIAKNILLAGLNLITCNAIESLDAYRVQSNILTMMQLNSDFSRDADSIKQMINVFTECFKFDSFDLL